MIASLIESLILASVRRSWIGCFEPWGTWGLYDHTRNAKISAIFRFWNHERNRAIANSVAQHEERFGK